MRTDSFQIAPKAKAQTKEFIKQAFGPDYLPEKDHKYKEKKGAQRAHEAIRPTSINRGPADMQESLGTDEAKLYELIWKRFLASLMSEAVYENTKYICKSQSGEFVAEGRRTVFEGFLKVFGKQDDDKILPELDKGAVLKILGTKPVDHTTKPPPRFNDASLVKVLEEKGIGRPSTYAPTIATILRRNYLKREKGYFMPTDLGIQVSDMLLKHFPSIMNENFTAHMEDNLDKVEEGKVKWQETLKEFFPDFKDQIDKATTVIKKHVEFSEKICPKCGGKMVIKWSRKGRFLSCEHFPKCKYAESITTDVNCPDCKEGKLIERRNKRGQFFYGCSNFPECRFTSRSLPKQTDESDNNESDQVKIKE